MDIVMLFVRDAPQSLQGTGDTEISAKQHKPRYRLFYKDQEPKDFFSLHEIADHLNLSYSCINRIHAGKNKANRKCFEYLKDVRITKIKEIREPEVAEGSETVPADNSDVTLNFN